MLDTVVDPVLTWDDKTKDTTKVRDIRASRVLWRSQAKQCEAIHNTYR